SPSRAGQHRADGDHRRVLVVLRFPEGDGCPRRRPKARPTPGRRKDWCAGPAEPGIVFVMFFQTPIYE
ncbi:hypothetical protein, partial [Streptomyces decoyicus]|uniref:hypothetical protein n=1 Tax=Streptomyces decoyicus TaxID=249567 RepID=UPI00366502BF